MKQEELLVDIYTRLFKELQYLGALDESELHELIRFMRGLRPDIEENMTYCKTIQEAYRQVIRFEHMFR